jgi:5-methylcytosine-specific restriction endonuclease McrA
MSGGFKRLATVIRQYKKQGKTLWIDAGDVIDTPGRQSQMKVETYAELMGDLGVDAVAYTSQDQRQGLGLLLAGSSLSKKKWLSSDGQQTDHTTTKSTTDGLTISAANENSTVLETEQPSDILLFDGKANQLDRLTKEHQLRIYSSDGTPSIEGDKVSPGSHLRGIIVAKFKDNRLVSTKVEVLAATIKDDPRAEKIYRNYLHRVREERLIDKVERNVSDDFAGSKNCRSCHTRIYDQYAKTKHAHAYDTLVKEEHQADPDCVSCHVVGLNSTKGFVFQNTPSLAQVGCESCHGAGRQHARNPKQIRLPKVTEEKCITCHTPSNSPTFNFQLYWKKIRH